MLKLSNGLGSLTLVCVKCTRESTIAAPSMEMAVEQAKLAGWAIAIDGSTRQTLYICPKCPSMHRLKQQDLSRFCAKPPVAA